MLEASDASKHTQSLMQPSPSKGFGDLGKTEARVRKCWKVFTGGMKPRVTVPASGEQPAPISGLSSAFHFSFAVHLSKLPRHENGARGAAAQGGFQSKDPAKGNRRRLGLAGREGKWQ